MVCGAVEDSPKHNPGLCLKVGTCLATLAWGVAGLDEIPRKAGASFAGARVLAFSFGLCWHLDSTQSSSSFMKRKAGRSCSRTPDSSADISSLVPLPALLSVTVRINPQALWHSVCHTDQELKKIKWIGIKGSKVIILIFTIFNSAPSRSLI